MTISMSFYMAWSDKARVSKKEDNIEMSKVDNTNNENEVTKQ
jgi:hypothetical protein